ncbi:mini-ribonuclease 3 [Clostridia bacterium]|nr:mini-ribonuclease 3 [Clostridia bacterium]
MMFAPPLTKERALALHPIVLAFEGDGVCALYARTRLIASSDKKAGALHETAKKYVSAYGQAAVYDRIWDSLNEFEQDLCRRARNTHNTSKAKNVDLETYKKATALEALIGYYYLIGENGRLEEILTRFFV